MENITDNVLRFTPNGKGYDVRTAEGKKGRIEKRRDGYRFVMTRNVSNNVLKSVPAFVQELNGQA